MKTLDIDALLEKNPKVDRDVIKGIQDKPAHPTPKFEKDSGITSPYNSRRRVVDEDSKSDEPTVIYRLHYGSR
jgi:hypothetical protein